MYAFGAGQGLHSLADVGTSVGRDGSPDDADLSTLRPRAQPAPQPCCVLSSTVTPTSPHGVGERKRKHEGSTTDRHHGGSVSGTAGRRIGHRGRNGGSQASSQDHAVGNPNTSQRARQALKCAGPVTVPADPSRAVIAPGATGMVAITCPAGSSYVFAVTPEGSPVSFVSKGVTVNEDGSVTYAPTLTNTGTETITVQQSCVTA
jgi:hypothetical protein